MFILPIVRPSAGNGDANEQNQQKNGDKDDQECRHICLPSETTFSENSASPRSRRPRRVNVLAASRQTAEPCCTSPATPPPPGGPGPGHSGATSHLPLLGRHSCEPGRIHGCGQSASGWVERSCHKHRVFLALRGAHQAGLGEAPIAIGMTAFDVPSRVTRQRAQCTYTISSWLVKIDI